MKTSPFREYIYVYHLTAIYRCFRKNQSCSCKKREFFLLKLPADQFEERGDAVGELCRVELKMQCIVPKFKRERRTASAAETQRVKRASSFWKLQRDRNFCRLHQRNHFPKREFPFPCRERIPPGIHRRADRQNITGCFSGMP